MIIKIHDHPRMKRVSIITDQGIKVARRAAQLYHRGKNVEIWNVFSPPRRPSTFIFNVG